MIKELFLSFILLQGICSKSSHRGACGFRINSFSHIVIRVFKPAQEAGIQVGDKYLETKDEEGNTCDTWGEAYEEVTLKFSRPDGQIIYIKMKRVPEDQIDRK